MTQKQSSGRVGADFGRKSNAKGPKTGPKLPGPSFWTVFGPSALHLRLKLAPNRILFLSHLRGGDGVVAATYYKDVRADRSANGYTSV